MTGIFKEVTIAITITSKVKHQCLPFSNTDFLSREKFYNNLCGCTSSIREREQPSEGLMQSIPDGDDESSYSGTGSATLDTGMAR